MNNSLKKASIVPKPMSVEEVNIVLINWILPPNISVLLISPLIELVIASIALVAGAASPSPVSLLSLSKAIENPPRDFVSPVFACSYFSVKPILSCKKYATTACLFSCSSKESTVLFTVLA